MQLLRRIDSTGGVFTRPLLAAALEETDGLAGAGHAGGGDAAAVAGADHHHVVGAAQQLDGLGEAREGRVLPAVGEGPRLGAVAVGGCGAGWGVLGVVVVICVLVVDGVDGWEGVRVIAA